ncbi:archaeal heat shock protein Hsp20 [Desulfurococcus amylolyticus]|uniref:Small heat shock protein HSP20 n=1 Tax=Desulfurococcus amylolyticus DSM 16532 TaxID=768672 RepID=I3XSD3_DESAM|nr:archaeal heat shock protein Hsp20 [Desulfurococcus amylolyticus]AFL66857.1 small heat shock protein HSP20 [Desulfurococcus amylolyticus DSM 16532]
MEDDWWYRRRRRPFWSEDLFDEIDKMFEDMERMVWDLMRRFSRGFTPEELREIERQLERQGIRPYVYGFSITIGPDGKPVIREFGNMRRERGKPVITEEREPLIDVFESGDEVTVIAEIPGVEKDKIDVKVSDDGRTLIINASDTNRRYYKEVELPSKVDPSSAKASYKNGVLEVKLKKAGKGKEGFKISVE